jgi:hypothetical protein
LSKPVFECDHGVDDMAEDRSKDQKKDQKKDQNEDRRQQADIQGEGDKRSARRFNEREQEFVEHTDVDEKAKTAKPKNAEEEREMRRAEAKAAERAKEHDPTEVRRKGPQ